MGKICVMLLDKGDSLFRFYKEMELSRVPVNGDKLFISKEKKEKTTTCVYEVVDVHFADHEATDVCVINIGKQEDYLCNLASIHNLK